MGVPEVGRVTQRQAAEAFPLVEIVPLQRPCARRAIWSAAPLCSPGTMLSRVISAISTSVPSLRARSPSDRLALASVGGPAGWRRRDGWVSRPPAWEHDAVRLRRVKCAEQCGRSRARWLHGGTLQAWGTPESRAQRSGRSTRETARRGSAAGDVLKHHAKNEACPRLLHDLGDFVP